MNNEWEKMWKETVLNDLRHYPGNSQEEMGKTTKKLHQDSGSSVPIFEPRPPEYEAGALTT
jgi:hypothetical protein